MSASKSIPSKPASTLELYRYGNGINETSEVQWSPDTTNVHGDPTPLQWTTVPQHPAPASTNGPSAPPYEGPKLPTAGVTTPIDLDNPNSFIHINSSQNSNGYNMLSAPMMTHGANGSSILLPPAPNSQITMLNGRNTWITPTPVSSTSQFITRAPAWNVTRTGGVKKPKRIRTAFTSQQMLALEKEYARARYLDRSRRIELAKELNLNERTIKIWFQNRRMKEKKDRAESLEDSEDAVDSSPEYGNIPLPMAVPHDFPTPVADAIFKQDGVYSEPYSATAAPLPMQPLALSHGMDSQMMNGYIYEYNQEQHMAFEYRQLQLQNEASEYVQEMQDISQQFQEEPTQSRDQGSLNTMPMAENENTDISWIRNIYPNEDC